MRFFKDIKEDLSQAVNELLPGEDVKGEEPKEEAEKSDIIENTPDAESELSKLDGLLEKVTKANQTVENLKKVEEDKNMSEQNNEANQAAMPEVSGNPAMGEGISDETSVITEGTRLKGNMESPGSFEIRGTVQGDVSCNGKLVVTGTIIGNSASSEFFADAAKIEGRS